MLNMAKPLPETLQVELVLFLDCGTPGSLSFVATPLHLSLWSHFSLLHHTRTPVTVVVVYKHGQPTVCVYEKISSTRQ